MEEQVEVEERPSPPLVLQVDQEALEAQVETERAAVAVVAA